jgi:proteasome lid subunit RPN8/RPN11
MFEIVRELIAIAKAEHEANPEKPNERCGVVVANGDKPKIIEIRNISTNPEKRFRFDPNEYARIIEAYDVLEIWHTHPNQGAAASQADLVKVEEFKVPWHIVSWPSAQHTYCKPCGYEAPYEDRVFYHGVLDCYSLCRDWYKREMGIELPDDERPDEWWNDPAFNIYVDGFEKNGFRLMGSSDFSDLKRGDGILIEHCTGTPGHPNHAAVYLGDGKILHHIMGRLSGITPYGGYWKKNATHILRHESQL